MGIQLLCEELALTQQLKTSLLIRFGTSVFVSRIFTSSVFFDFSVGVAQFWVLRCCILSQHIMFAVWLYAASGGFRRIFVYGYMRFE